MGKRYVLFLEQSLTGPEYFHCHLFGSPPIVVELVDIGTNLKDTLCARAT